MRQTLAANEVTLGQLKAQFGLQLSEDPQFFPEWMEAQTDIDASDRQVLDRVKANFLALQEQPPLLENSVKMVVLSPLLDLAGFYRSPFRIQTEASVSLEMEDEGTIVRGRIDILVEKHGLWLLVIESKRSDFAVTGAIPQALTYMLSQPEGDRPSFGAIVNGSEFLFLKVIRQPTPRYANSRLFSLVNPGNELYSVLQILRKLEQTIVSR